MNVQMIHTVKQIVNFKTSGIFLGAVVVVIVW